ncbi:MAG: radical SAM family heme chaperone HemW [Candidatus Marinimicrobia bacterium]|nr:radical SAM family heme chaperone HemW [Candidatus Neomarinimicrobiota bacterium]
MSSALKPLALYIHVPFCKSKCTYCDFYSVVGRENAIPDFLKVILSEIEHKKATLDLSNYSIDTIFFGGGTPNLLAPPHLEQIINALLELASPRPDMEVGMEINPGEAALEDFQAYNSLGINRISIGMQSFQPQLLKFMSRIHSAQKSISTYEDVRRAGFNNVSADLIFAIPGQTNQLWEADLSRLVELAPEHISTYSLTVEEGTALHRWVVAGHVHMLEETLDTGMYAMGRDYLNSQGYPNYEISNHARPGFECRHNLNYWTGVEYLGFGPAAHSFFKDRRHWNVRNLDQYLSMVAESGIAEEASEIINDDTARNEMILTRLRLTQGLNLSEYTRRFGADLLDQKREILAKWNEQIDLHHGHLSVTRSGWSMIDEISSDLMFINGTK